VAIRTAVEARDLDHIGTFRLLLSTKLGDMSKFLAVQAKRNTSIHDFASVIQTREKFVPALRPPFELTRTISMLDKAIRNGVFLVDMALKVHVGENRDESSLSRNEPEANAVVDQCFLELAISNITIDGLDVLLDRLLNVVDVLITDGLFDFVPGVIGADISDVVAVNLARLFAILAHVAWTYEHRASRSNGRN
jgi:hypothetical protein